ncbi:MAG: universal stress protein [Acidobacteria bacterium]|nr:universal stress protein [Acidobacteriota bacterium]
MKILLAIDDSKFSQAALKMVLAQYPPRKTTVRVLHVVEPYNLYYYPETTPAANIPNLVLIQKQMDKRGRDLVARVAEKLRAAGYKAETAVAHGDVRTAVVDAAAKWSADVVVLGSHGRKGIERFLLGSVSDYVARHAPCSVQIIRLLRKR